MDINEEYQIRKKLSELTYQEVETKLKKVSDVSKGKYSSLIAYPLAALEHQYKVISEKSVIMRLPAMELLITLNPLRQAIYWFVKEMMKRNSIKYVEGISYDFTDEEFGHSVCDFVLPLHEEYRNAQILDIHRSVAKVDFNKLENNTYEILFPSVKEEYSKEMLYYYGMDDPLSSEVEREKVVKVDSYIFSIFNTEKLIKHPQRLLEYMEKNEYMINNIDAKLYRLCRSRVAIDINKIAKEIESDVVKDKSELINVIALFYYLSRLNMQKYTFNVINPILSKKNLNFCDFSFENLIDIGKKVGIYEDTLIKYIDYFSVNSSVEKGSFAEFPFIVLDGRVIWLPSSFLLNDFQFSIVNGHYYKNINFPNHMTTIAQSIVDYIVDSSKTYLNIVSASNYLYSVQEMKFNGKDLQSDIDVALYDRINNVMLIIECKWLENVYTYTDDFVKIERAVRTIYKTQLDKHKFYLSLDDKNYEKVFDNKISLADKVDTMEVFYLFVDKRIQFHNREENYHVIPTFMLSYLLKKYAEGDCVDLRKIICDIKDKNTEPSYTRKKLVNTMVINGKNFV